MRMLGATLLMALGTGVLLGSAPVVAQTEQEFVEVLIGDWEVYDDAYGVDGNNCRITLKDTKIGDDYELAVESCNLEMGMISSWRITEGQLELVAGEGVVAALGGNQFRMSGNSSIGAPVILDRVGETDAMDRLVEAYEASGCYYLGFTSTCVDEAQLGKPAVPADGSAISIGILVNLNARAEAREDADVIGVVPANSCIVADVCATASDGVWCRARFGDSSGWLKKLALRQDRWAVVTFVNQCQAN